MNAAAAIYACTLMHRRHRPIDYVFRYRIFSLLLDIDRLDEIASISRWFSVDRFNLFSFYRSDHLGPGEDDLRPWLERVLSEAGIENAGLRVRLLCMPRVLGLTFNPLSIWYCEYPSGEPVAAVCEVHNTFGERHCYLIPADGHGPAWPIRGQHRKDFHVSPFMQVSGRYLFTLHRPEEQLRVLIHQEDEDGALLSASQLGERHEFSSRELLLQSLRVPFQTVKVLSAIHWQALKIWLRGVPFHRKPEPPLKEIS